MKLPFEIINFGKTGDEVEVVAHPNGESSPDVALKNEEGKVVFVSKSILGESGEGESSGEPEPPAEDAPQDLPMGESLMEKETKKRRR